MAFTSSKLTAELLTVVYSKHENNQVTMSEPKTALQQGVTL